ncbi:MAG TPA: helix-turn-helix transcriptional regulator [Leptolyngbyaceae cyanobacterium M33_DOE_097]|uniref:AraC family transcriptional regulator n=1 Tax=Oscillatoriales cyanobacterium SpSt-418 TaxID=2282169 RepID=A0A7C3KGT9_9CYAN|nr:helix-turn-helix transcriptional regulator [Leptolyngbyaceae cyanobacterium M33_DOE_097]
MKMPFSNLPECTCTPILSSQSQGWENILVEQFQHPSGEGATQYNNEHTICLSLSPRPVRFLQIKAGKTHSSLYGKGDISITPAQMPFFARWEGEDHYMQIRLTTQFIQAIASETLDTHPDRLELAPEFRTRDPQIEAIALMLLTELQQNNVGSALYINSLTNVLAVHLIRNYASIKPNIPIYSAGLPERKLAHVVEYIHHHLEEDIKLSDLAALLGMSQFHFCRLFKQSLGVTPYQYLLQQRVERAKQLLKQTDHSIMEIAFLCGFNSHSHLTKQFRQLTGMTPTVYRSQSLSV